jgi:HK97 gp10 family phage protein
MADFAGLGQALVRVQKLSSDIAEAASAGHQQLAEQAAEDMRANVPVDTGRLQESIRVERKNAFRTEVIAGDETTQYLGHVEFGTVNDDAQPFVRPAAGQAESVHGAVMLKHAKSRVR